MTDYGSFLASKLHRAVPVGIPGASVDDRLFPFQRDIVRWALARGRAAIFADCGMGKTIMQLEWSRRVLAHSGGGGRALIIAPLAVAQQTVREGARFGIPVTYRRDGAVELGITITNYEMLERFDPRAYAAVVLDESSILKSHDGPTRTAIIDAFRETPFRLACTATPAPNDHMELGNHAEFLGVATRVEMLARYFVHDGGDTSKWRLKGHAEDDFWRWVCSWACMIRRPSDLDYSDDGFTLPPIVHHEHVVGADHGQAQRAGMLFAMPASTLIERRAARSASIDDRVALAAELVASRPDEPWLLWCGLNAEGDALERAIPGAVQVAGADSSEVKEDRMLGFSEGRYRVLITKPSIAGFGLNWQHCSNMIFVGLSDSYEQIYQATSRCWRFGQRRPVHVHIVVSEIEGAVVANVKRKEADAQAMADGMAEHTRAIVREEIASAAEREVDTYQREVATSPRWTLHRGDCVDVVRELADESIDYTVFSPPFASLYTYSASPRDMGNCDDHDAFARHFGFLIPELLRVTKPGRLLSFHCMNLPTSKTRDGVIGISDFRGTLIRAFVDAGWIFHSEVCIWKDPVTAMQRTKALGLLYKQLRKDSAMSRQGIPDYLVTMRKPGVNPEPVTKDSETFPVGMWQRYASPVWMDIDPSDTLQRESAREEKDERHICPLQLGVIERAVQLWTNPVDLVLSPFAGIGSEGVVSLRLGRRFVGAELKNSYWAQARRNLGAAEHEGERQPSLFGA